jgi:hypothetical protein
VTHAKKKREEKGNHRDTEVTEKRKKKRGLSTDYTD